MNILITGAYNFTLDQENQLNELGHKVIFLKDERLPLITDVSNVDIVICNALFLYNDITLFNNLKLIQLTSAGYDRIPLEYIKKNNIRIYNAGSTYSVPMAEWGILKILEIYKYSSFFLENRNRKIWSKKRNLKELCNSNALILGFGNVGKEIAKRLNIFGVNILALDKNRDNSILEVTVASIDTLKEVLPMYDIIILTLPLVESTKHLFNREILNLVKDDAVLVNISRGGIIDEEALVSQLDKGKFRGVALDVFEVEPLPSESKLWNFENVLISPHNSFVSDLNDGRLFELFLRNINTLVNN